MNRQVQTDPIARRFINKWNRRFGVNSPTTRDAFAQLGRLFFQNASEVQDAFSRWRTVWRSVSEPVFKAQALRALEPWRAALGPTSVAELDRLDERARIDVFFFLLQTLVAQTILAVVAADFSLDAQELDALFPAFPFDWNPALRQTLRVTAGDLKTLRLHETARSSDPFEKVYARVFAGSLRRALGEFYTPPTLAGFLYDRAKRLWRDAGAPADAIPTVLDPTCGAGVFLTTAIRRMLDSGVAPEDALGAVRGCDLSPLALLAARANLLYAALSRTDASTPEKRRDALDRLLMRRRERVFRDSEILPATALDAVTLAVPGAGIPKIDAPCKRFDLILGNPPWLAWDALTEGYRQATTPRWQEFNLFTLSGRQARYGGAKKELAGLIVTISVARRLDEMGVFAFVLPRNLFQSSTAGEGFRRFGEGEPWSFAALELDDLSEIPLFTYTNGNTIALLGRARAATRYPIAARRWRLEPTPLAPDAAPELRRAADAFKATVDFGTAAPGEDKPGAPLALRFPTLERATRRVDETLCQRADALTTRLFEETTDAAPRYRAKLGANAAGASGVFWFDDVPLDAQIVNAANRGDSGRRKVPSVTARLESALLFPLLRWRDVDEFYAAAPDALMLVPQDPARRQGYAETTMREKYPLTLRYLERFEEPLRTRAAYRRYQKSAPYWSLYNVDETTFAPFKVVWRRMDSTLRAAVVEYDEARRRPVVPQETLSFVSVASLDEADYLAAALNSEPSRARVAERLEPGSRSFGTPGILDALPIPRYDEGNALCRELAALGRELRVNAKNARG